MTTSTVNMALKKTKFFNQNIQFTVEEVKHWFSTLFLVNISGDYDGAYDALNYLKNELKHITGKKIWEAKILEIEKNQEVRI
jgi:hypothetical protein